MARRRSAGAERASGARLDSHKALDQTCRTLSCDSAVRPVLAVLLHRTIENSGLVGGAAAGDRQAGGCYLP